MALHISDIVSISQQCLGYPTHRQIIMNVAFEELKLAIPIIQNCFICDTLSLPVVYSAYHQIPGVSGKLSFLNYPIACIDIKYKEQVDALLLKIFGGHSKMQSNHQEQFCMITAEWTIRELRGADLRPNHNGGALTSNEHVKNSSPTMLEKLHGPVPLESELRESEPPESRPSEDCSTITMKRKHIDVQKDTTTKTSKRIKLSKSSKVANIQDSGTLPLDATTRTSPLGDTIGALPLDGTTGASPLDATTAASPDSNVLYLDVLGQKAYGCVPQSRKSTFTYKPFVVLKGSYALKLPNNAHKDILVDKGILIPVDDMYYRFGTSHEFAFRFLAGFVILGAGFVLDNWKLTQHEDHSKQ